MGRQKNQRKRIAAKRQGTAKCLRPGCRHAAELHRGPSGSCTAWVLRGRVVSRCACEAMASRRDPRRVVQ